MLCIMTDRFCTVHNDHICKLYSDVLSASKCVPGWMEHVAKLIQESLYWHRCWKVHGKPHQGDIAEMRRITRAGYHHAVKTIKNYLQKSQKRIFNAAPSSSIAVIHYTVMISPVKLLKCHHPLCSIMVYI